ncbi:hypothetical protein [Oceanobacillus rekensis]|uniref:hypothetical protein n=1 Tax=Oceanobacillus rekensis TaxID=937927 RepID=UPI000B4546BB|nr:hypothetical protein [Oceanobacillus rekensis]
MEEKKVYIVLTDTGTLFTKMIKFYTRKPYNHASISCDADLSEVYSFGRKKPNNPFIGGFVRENFKTGLFKQSRAAIYCCTVSDHQLQKANDYIKRIEKQKDQFRYNFLGLFGVILNKPVKRKNAYFCSQFVATVLKECDIIEFPKPLSLVMPHDLQEAEDFQLVYQGKLAHFYTDGNREEMTQPKLNLLSVEI